MSLASQEQQVEENVTIASHFAKELEPLWCQKLPWGHLSVLVGSSAAGALGNCVAKVATERQPLLQGFREPSQRGCLHDSILCSWRAWREGRV